MPEPESRSVPVTVRVQDGVARISLDRPPLNVLDIDMLRQLNEALRQCDRTSIRVVVLESALPRAFSAGVDVRDHGADRVDAMLTEVRENARLLLSLTPVTIAAIHGTALGGGAEIALLCDLVIAADDLTFGFPEIKLAAFPPVAAACLAQRCGTTRALQLLLGEPIDATAAHRAGLVSRVVPANQLRDTAVRVAADLANYSAVALGAVTTAARTQPAKAILERLDRAIALYQTRVARSHDAEEGIRAFLDKRTPVWSHH